MKPGRLLALAAFAAGCGGSAPAPPSVVLVTLDTTRIDHLPPYGYPRAITPNLSAFSEQAVRFTRAWSTSAWTLPAHASLFTGLYPESHGAHADPEGALSLEDATGNPMGSEVPVGALPAEAVTLAELLAERGYHTGAFAGGPWLRRAFGLLQGFAHADDAVDHAHGRRADTLTDRALAWLASVPAREPYFLFVNYFDPHAPFDPPAGFDDLPRAGDDFVLEPLVNGLLRGERQLSDAERAVVVDRYDGEIRFMDHHLGRLLHAVAAGDGGALVVVTADHGEAFGEGGRWFHTYWLSEEILRVPLWVRHPDGRGAGTSDDSPMQLVDVVPLVAAELGLELPAGVEGLALGRRQRAFSRLFPQRFGALIAPGRLGRGREAVIEWPFKLVHVNREGRRLLRVDRWPEAPARDAAVRRRLVRELEAARAARRPPSRTAPDVDPETQRLLRDLGYAE